MICLDGLTFLACPVENIHWDLSSITRIKTYICKSRAHNVCTYSDNVLNSQWSVDVKICPDKDLSINVFVWTSV